MISTTDVDDVRDRRDRRTDQEDDRSGDENPVADRRVKLVLPLLLGSRIRVWNARVHHAIRDTDTQEHRAKRRNRPPGPRTAHSLPLERISLVSGAISPHLKTPIPAQPPLPASSVPCRSQ